MPTYVRNRIVRNTGFGVYQASEGHILYTRKGIRRGGTGLIFAHGRNDTYRALDTTTNPYTTILRRVVQLGIPVLCCDLGGTQTWGNATVLARMATAFTWMQANAGVRSDRLLLAGASMGHLNCANYSRTNLSLVKGILGVFPVANLPAMRGAYGAEIDTAYTDNAGYLAALATSDPATWTVGTPPPPSYLMHSTGDTTVSSANVTAYAALNPSRVTAVQTATAGAHITCAISDAESNAAAEWIVARA